MAVAPMGFATTEVSEGPRLDALVETEKELAAMAWRGKGGWLLLLLLLLLLGLVLPVLPDEPEEV